MTEHLDDETLSATIDGESPPGAREHVASCPDCASRLAALQMVVSTISASAVPAAGDEEAARAVTAAIDAAVEAGLGPRPDTTAHGVRAGVVVALRRRPAALALAAAAVLILAAGITGALRLGRSSTLPAAEKSASVPRANVANPANAAANAGNGGNTAGAVEAAPAFSPVVTGPDLGAQTDAATVARLVRARLSAAPSSGTATPAANDQAVMACAPEAASAAGVSATSPLRLIAPLQWRGQPAVVFVFERPGTASGLAGVIVRQTDCGALATLPL